MSSTTKNGLYTDSSDSIFPEVGSIPLRDADTHAAGQGSINRLVKDASAQISTLVRTEIELAKAEIAQSVKKGAIGGAMFAIAAVIAFFSSFFLFFTLAEVLDIWLYRWAAFAIVFAGMLILAGIFVLIGLKQIKQVKKPEATIDSFGKLPDVVPSGSSQAGSTKAARSTNIESAEGLYS
ncbi:phage holin family protein [Corynebacterium kroppenstedtii]|uniref:phage holin family protein n=1 Tax=Corynebacterium sp. PCR 32 TaxID=3351342 RepID=UPI003753DFFB